MALQRGSNRRLLLAGMILGLVGGGFAGWSMGERAVEYFGFLGQFFLTALKMLVLPLIVCSLISAVGQLGDIRRLGRTASATLLYFAATTSVAVLVGIVLINVMRPGLLLRQEGGEAVSATAQIVQRIEGLEKEIAALEGSPAADRAQRLERLRAQLAMQKANLAKVRRFEGEERSLFAVLQEVLLLFVTPDLLRGAPGVVRGDRVEQPPDTLAIIVFAIILGALLTTVGPKGRVALEVIDGLNLAILKFVNLVIWIAPVGIFGLVAAQLGKTGGGEAFTAELARLGRYALTVIVGLIVHGFVILPIVLVVLGRRHPWRFVMACSHALVNAFSTASSGATLPLSLEAVENRAGVRSEAARFVVPLGATVNMNGTALYEAVAVLFIAQANGLDLGMASQAVIFLTASLAAVGAAAIPEAGLVTMVIVLRAVNLPAEWIGLILSIDWFLDRCRTTINVWGDYVGAAVVERYGFAAEASVPAKASAGVPARSGTLT